MKFYISPTGIKKVASSNSGGGAAAAVRGRLSNRTVLPIVLVLGILLPFLFVRVAFLVLESASACSSAIDCMGWRLFVGIDPSQKLREELSKALTEATDGNSFDDGSVESSFNELVRDIMTAKRQDIRTFASKTKSMLQSMEHKVQSARNRELIFWHLASLGVPKSLHCLSLKLAEEYAVNALARSRLPPPQHVSRLSDPSFNHLVLLTDNVLAASVVVSSTVQNAASPENLVFHIVTDKKTYTPMHAWFAINSFNSAVVEVTGLHQYEWSQEVNIGVKHMLEMNRLIWGHHYKIFKEDSENVGELNNACLEALHPSCLSLLNLLRIYIPELFPDLNKIVFLDDDVVVQHDLSTLWTMDLNGKVAGAVYDSWCGDNCCPGRKYKEYFNFSQAIVSENFDPDHCAWLYGMNIFDLETWRRKNITAAYHEWLRNNLNFGFTLWQSGTLPPALAALKDNVHPIDPLWHVAGLGYRTPDTAGRGMLEAAAVIHFSGPAKPWLEIGFSDAQRLWMKHVNFSNEFIRKCRILG